MLKNIKYLEIFELSFYLNFIKQIQYERRMLIKYEFANFFKELLKILHLRHMS